MFPTSFKLGFLLAAYHLPDQFITIQVNYRCSLRKSSEYPSKAIGTVWEISNLFQMI